MASIDKLRAPVAAVVREFLAEEGLAPGQRQQGKTIFSVLEETAVEVGDAITQKVLREELAACDPLDRCCPECGHGGLHQGERQRMIRTRRRPVEVTKGRYCPPCRRAFFPRSKALGLDVEHDYSPAVWKKVICAATQAGSFEQGARDLKELAELDISDQRVRPRKPGGPSLPP